MRQVETLGAASTSFGARKRDLAKTEAGTAAARLAVQTRAMLNTLHPIASAPGCSRREGPHRPESSRAAWSRRRGRRLYPAWPDEAWPESTRKAPELDPAETDSHVCSLRGVTDRSYGHSLPPGHARVYAFDAARRASAPLRHGAGAACKVSLPFEDRSRRRLRSSRARQSSARGGLSADGGAGPDLGRGPRSVWVRIRVPPDGLGN